MNTIRMYLLKRENRSDDYVAVLGENIQVTSGLLKHIWTDPDRCDIEQWTFPYTLETYYGDSTVLENAELLWERDVE